jgi:hypothetical protein
MRKEVKVANLISRVEKGSEKGAVKKRYPTEALLVSLRVCEGEGGRSGE